MMLLRFFYFWTGMLLSFDHRAKTLENIFTMFKYVIKDWIFFLPIHANPKLNFTQKKKKEKTWGHFT